MVKASASRAEDLSALSLPSPLSVSSLPPLCLSLPSLPPSLSPFSLPPSPLSLCPPPLCPPSLFLSLRLSPSLCVPSPLSLLPPPSLPLFHRLVGLVARRPPRERKIPGSNPACAGIFPGMSHTSDLKLALQWLPYQAPGVIGSVLGLAGPVSVHCDWVRWKVWSVTSQCGGT